MTLRGVSETLYIPLYARALETKRPDAIVSDPLAVTMADTLRYDYSRFGMFWVAQTGIAVRTLVLDRETKAFLRRHPGAVVVNLGAGLCTRFMRVGDGAGQWFEIDLPEVAQVWRTLLRESDRHRFLAQSVMDFSWIADVRQAGGDAHLFIAEGVLMYFRPEDVRDLLREIVRQFPGAELLIEAIGPVLARSSSIHPLISKTNARFRWGIRSLHGLAGQVPGLRLLEEWYLFDFFPRRWGALRWMFWCGWFRRQLRIGHLRIDGPVVAVRR